MKIFLVVTFVIFYILTALGFYDAAKFNFKYGDWQKYIATAL